MDRLTITSCPLCGSTHLERTLTCVDHCASGEMFHLSQCKECRFLFTQGFPTENQIDRYYATPEYISHSDTHKGVVNTLYHWVRGYMLGRKARLVDREAHRKGGSLLDVGTGTGYFADTMRRRGWQVEATEKNDGARAFAKARFGLEVKPAQALWTFAPGSFDVVTLWHTLEHLEPLDKVWEKLKELLSEKGVLIVAVPNCSSYDARKYGAYWAAYDVPRHLWHFTPATIQRFGAKHGFILAERYAMPFDAFYISMLSEKYCRHANSFLRGVATGISAWFRTLVRKERGSSMIYVFRKKNEQK
ncbi:MAG: class I SAM-dependent methyltransferase [Prevotellaceae bacterium]|nr:class I SAM-dependent methyltransferase [Prevotellaceae bacterium]